MEAIRAEGLSRRFGNNTVVDGVDLRVQEGEILGFIGPNGAGKTTTWAMLTGLLRPNQGTVHLLSRPVNLNDAELKRMVGVVPDHCTLFENLTGEELLLSYGRIYGLGRRDASQRADEALRVFDLEEASTRPITTYSHGMKKRIRLAAATLHVPRILFLDEPFEGMDASAARTVMSILRQLSQEAGTSIFLTSHMLDYVERVSTHLSVIKDGKVMLSCSREEFQSRTDAIKVDEGAGRLENLILSLSRRGRFSRRLSWVGGEE